VVLHFANKPKPWNEGNRFHKEWQNNLLLAEKINLSEPRQSIKTLNHSELKIQNEYSRITLFLARVRNRMRKYDDYFKEIIRQLLYRIGRLIKKVSPKLYYKIGGKN
jgi:lipopolysaccharide biosynthesis glycosyltransferase